MHLVKMMYKIPNDLWFCVYPITCCTELKVASAWRVSVCYIYTDSFHYRIVNVSLRFLPNTSMTWGSYHPLMRVWAVQYLTCGAPGYGQMVKQYLGIRESGARAYSRDKYLLPRCLLDRRRLCLHHYTRECTHSSPQCIRTGHWVNLT